LSVYYFPENKANNVAFFPSAIDHICHTMRGSKKLKTIFAYLKSYAGSSGNDGRYKSYTASFICKPTSFYDTL
jgi:hypothetical protein